MKCRDFEMSLSEWVRGRLSGPEVSAMAAHRDACGPCREAESTERELDAAFAPLRHVARQPILLPRLADRIAARPRHRFAIPTPFRWALVGFGAASLAFVLATNRAPVTSPAVADHVDEGRIVQLVADAQAPSDPDSDLIVADLRTSHDDARRLIVGR